MRVLKTQIFFLPKDLDEIIDIDIEVCNDNITRNLEVVDELDEIEFEPNLYEKIAETSDDIVRSNVTYSKPGPTHGKLPELDK
mgnify:CR=1 FL=1